MSHPEEPHPEPTSSSNNDNTDKGLFMGLVLGMGAAALGFTTAAGVMVWKTHVEKKLKEDLSSKQEQILAKETEIHERQFEIRELEDQILEFKEEQSDALSEITNTLRSARVENSTLVSQLHEIQGALGTLEASKREELAAQLAHLETERSDWAMRSEAYESIQRKTLSEMDDLKAQLERLRHEHEALSQKDKNSAAEEVGYLEGELSRLQKELAHLHHMARGQPNVRRLQPNMIRLNQELQEVIGELSDLQHNADTTDVHHLMHELQDMGEDVHALHGDMDRLLEDSSSRQTERQQYAAAIGRLHAMHASETEHRRQAYEMEREKNVHEIRKHILSLEREHAGMLRDVEMLRAQLDEIYSKKGETEKHLRSLRQEGRQIEVKSRAASEPPQDSSEKTVAEDSPPSEAPRTIPKHTTEQKLGRGGGGKQWKPKGTRDPKSWMTRGEKSSTTEDSSAP